MLGVWWRAKLVAGYWSHGRGRGTDGMWMGQGSVEADLVSRSVREGAKQDKVANGIGLESQREDSNLMLREAGREGYAYSTQLLVSTPIMLDEGAPIGIGKQRQTVFLDLCALGHVHLASDIRSLYRVRLHWETNDKLGRQVRRR